MADNELSVADALGSDFFPESEPEPEKPKRGRGRPRKDETAPPAPPKAEGEFTPRTPEQARKEAERIARELQEQVNEFVASWLVDHGVDPAKVYKNPARRKVVASSVYADEVQHLMMQENTARSVGKLITKLDDYSKGKFEKVKNSPLGLVFTAVGVLASGLPYVRTLMRTVAEVNRANAPVPPEETAVMPPEQAPPSSFSQFNNTGQVG